MPGSAGGSKEETEPKQPCAFFLKTGSCAFGDQCKFEHPADQPPTQYNSLGLPLRPGEPECAYYAKNLHCGYGASCKFHHSEPSVSWVPVPVMDSYSMRLRPNYPAPLPSYNRFDGQSGAQMFAGPSTQVHGAAHSYVQPYGIAPQNMGTFSPAYAQQLAQQLGSLQLQHSGIQGNMPGPMYQPPMSAYMSPSLYQQRGFIQAGPRGISQPRYMPPPASGQLGPVMPSQHLSSMNVWQSSGSPQGSQGQPEERQADLPTQKRQASSRPRPTFGGVRRFGSERDKQQPEKS